MVLSRASKGVSMSRFLISLGSLILASQFVVAAPVAGLNAGITCMTQPFPTTVTRAQELSSGKVLIDWIHYNGVEYMPMHDDIVVPQDIPILAERAEIFRELGAWQKFEFTKEQCKSYGDLLFRCENFKAPVMEIRGHKVQVVAFFTEHLQSRSFGGTFFLYTTTVHYEIDGHSVFAAMKYNIEDCKPL